MNDRKECLIRTCDGCGVVTAFDVDNTPEHKADIELYGGTVTEISMAELNSMRDSGRVGPCRCSVSALKQRIRELEDAAKRELKWTKTLPTVAGWYWIRRIGSTKPGRIEDVYQGPGHLSFSGLPLASMTCFEWAGPINPPAEGGAS
ncbi:hypothetical protein M0R72_21750 [Candidatus Pacearchaeota archaeon]|jgi:hypothetical protein|nr:hypothetical protein [Candidatus Pacearchaeota archaeon]